MLFRLVLGGRAFGGRIIEQGRIMRWYKREGDSVDYGDDLYDLQVQAVTTPKWQIAPKWQRETKRRRATVSEPTRIFEMASNLEPRALPAEADQESPITTILEDTRWKGGFLMRVTAADTGIMRNIYAEEGQQRVAGDLLALLSMHPDDPMDQPGDLAKRATVFRVIEDHVLWDEDPSFGAESHESSDASWRSRLQALRRRLRP